MCVLSVIIEKWDKLCPRPFQSFLLLIFINVHFSRLCPVYVQYVTSMDCPQFQNPFSLNFTSVLNYFSLLHSNVIVVSGNGHGNGAPDQLVVQAQEYTLLILQLCHNK
jgi:hypothetical protein